MLQLDHPDKPLHPHAARTPGGFAWWYADAINAAGDGFVCIWSYGLPFLPGLASSERAGAPTVPLHRPSVNLVTYERGHPTSYTLQELAPHHDAPSGTQWQFGECHFHLSRDSTRATLEGRLHLPTPGGEPLRGTFRITGVAAAPQGAAHDVPVHLWTPLMGAATATATFDVGERPLLRLHNASGYHDRNGGTTPIHRLGLQRWLWGRHTLGEDQVVWYLSYPADDGAEPLLWLHRTGPDGRSTLRAARATLQAPTRTWLGLRWWRQITLNDGDAPIVVNLDPPCDSGPFYLRMQATAEQGPHRARGWAELCEPDRIDAAWSRPFVRMCVTPPGGPGSRWLPLFSGERRTRWRRLRRWWADPALPGPIGREVRP